MKETEKPSNSQYEFSLQRYGLFESPADFNLNQAIKRMYSHIFCLLTELKRLDQTPQAVVIEIPEIVYAGKTSPKAILSRAASIIDTASVAAMFYTYCMTLGIDVATVKPREWQSGKQRPRKVSSKVWSLTVANSILSGIGSSRKLGTVKDENIADAIVMGQMLIPSIFSQQVLFY